jgi:hypothetical protein
MFNAAVAALSSRGAMRCETARSGRVMNARLRTNSNQCSSGRLDQAEAPRDSEKFEGRTMGTLRDLTNQKYGRLTVLRRAENNKFGHVWWLCECSCAAYDYVISKLRPLRDPIDAQSLGRLVHRRHRHRGASVTASPADLAGLALVENSLCRGREKHYDVRAGQSKSQIPGYTSR